MAITVQCPVCMEKYRLRDELAGKTCRCTSCGEKIRIPQSSAIAESKAPISPPGSPKSTVAKPSPAPTASASSSSLKAANESPSKPTPPKIASPKATLSQPTPAKPKPPTKPQPAPKKKPEDDFFEDDGEIDEVEKSEEEWDTPRRSKSRRPKKSATAKQYGRIGTFVAAGTGKMVWRMWLIGMQLVGVVGFIFFAFFVIGFFIRPNLLGGIVGLVMFGMLWLGFKGVRGKGIPVGPDNEMEGFPAELIGSVLVLTSNPFGWFVILMLVGFVRFQNGMLVVGPQAAVPVAQPMGGATPSQQAAVPNAVERNTNDDFQIANIPIPEFQDLSAFRPMLGNVMFGQSATKPGTQPGSRMQLAYYEPAGVHQPRSVPCVIMANGGTILMSGMTVPSPDNDPETRRYVEVGFAVLKISLDGNIPDSRNPPLAQLQEAFFQFRDAQAGLVNVRNGVEFLIRKVPQVDPNRLFIAGHDSAGTLALLAAAYEPRLKGCVAYSPVSDSAARLRKILSDPRAEIGYPGLSRFAKQVSPVTHVSRIACPIYLFHAADDQVISVNDSRRFDQLLKSHGKKGTYLEVPTGGHEAAVIQQGIPRAISWLKQLTGMSGSDAVPVVAQDTTTQRPNSGITPVPPVPQFPFPNFPQNANAARQPSGRMVTFRFQSFGGQGDATAAARQALRDVPWADLNDLAIDPAKGEIQIGQLGGAVNSGPAHQALTAAGFQMLPGVSIGSKASMASTAEPRKNETTKPATTTLEDIPEMPAKNPPANSEASKSKPANRPPPNNPPEKRPERATARRIVTFRYERFTGKGASANAMKEALKRINWADQEDLVLDATKKEIRIGLLAESPDFEQARKALTSQGFVMSTGVTTSTTKD